MYCKFSVIIPHYNIPDLLMRCLKSIPVSKDIQVIVVDDNSPDADTYLDRYPELSRPYLEFIRTSKGGGAGYARNIGLDHAVGEWVIFADADDYFSDNAYNLIFSKVSSDADIVFYRHKKMLPEGYTASTDNEFFLDRVFAAYFSLGDEWPIRFRYDVPWGRMIKRSLITSHNIHFDEIRYGNDALFSVYIGYYAKKIEVVDMILYYYTFRSKSLSSDFCSKPDELKVRSDVAFRIDLFLLNHHLCRQRKLSGYLIRMLKQDRNLFSFYFNNRLDDVYPSRMTAIRDICGSLSLKGKVAFFLYSLLVWKKG